MSEKNYNENSLDAVLARMDEKLDTLIEMRRNHEKRISALERWKYWVMGIGAVLVLLLECGDSIKKFLTGK